jgi:hypothetical protein
MATFVYGFNTVIARRSLWADLHRWFLIGVISILFSIPQISTMGRSLTIKSLILEPLVQILGFMILIIWVVTSLGLMGTFRVKLIEFW